MVRRLSALVALLLTANANAALVTFTNLSDYNAAVGAHAVIDFTSLADGTILGNQFAGLGATFTDGNDSVTSSSAFVADGKGMVDDGSSTIVFSSPQNHFGVEFPGAVRIELFSGATLLSSNDFGSAGQGFFGGVLDAGATFDKVVLSDWFAPPGFYDNLHFGTVPEPATLALFGILLAGLGFARRNPAR